MLALISLLLPILLISHFPTTNANEDAKRLYDELLTNYNRHRRPSSPNETVDVLIKLRLSQIIDVHELSQIMTCSVWLKQSWVDTKLRWDTNEYGGVSVLYVPYEMIWVPDIVLFNSAAGTYNITINTKATLHSSGLVVWEPPAIFKSLCPIDIRWFPFDEQLCSLKFGSWTYPSRLVNLTLETIGNDIHQIKEITNEGGEKEMVTMVRDAIDLSDYYPSVEWEIMLRNAERHERNRGPNKDSYVEVTYFLALRRKPLFYTVNLVFPCVGISFMTVLVFYLPSDSGEKVSLCINILVALSMFFLLLIEIIPANSISLPFVGKYLLFTMILVSSSVLVTVVALQFHFRKPATHTMSNSVRRVFLKWLPRLLFMQRPTAEVDGGGCDTAWAKGISSPQGGKVLINYHEHRLSRASDGIGISVSAEKGPLNRRKRNVEASDRLHQIYSSPAAIKSFENLCFIAELLKKKARDNKMDQDWKFVAMVVDRLFLLVFAMVCVFGTTWILIQAPTFYDYREPIDLQYRPAIDLELEVGVENGM